MKILILGATGRTGKYLIREALKKGHQVSAIARDPKALSEFTGIEITQGTPYDAEIVDKAIKGCDAVINTINISRKTENLWAPLRAPSDLISKTCANAMLAMKKYGIKRFVALSTMGAGDNLKKAPFILRFLVNNSNLKPAFADHGKQEKMLMDSDLDYTICRAPVLTMKEDSAAAANSEDTKKPKSMTLSRKAAAEFMIKITENKEYIRQAVVLTDTGRDRQ